VDWGLKATWLDPVRAARRLAAHANASRGALLLWLIGVDEIQGIVGVDRGELSNWRTMVNSEFDELPPDMTALNIPTPAGTVVALLFETDRAPYVVKNPQGGTVQFEVPWRDGNATRSAHRSEVLRLLVPLQAVPALELTSVRLDIGDATLLLGTGEGIAWVLDAMVYVVPKSRERVVFPLHRCGVTTKFEDSNQILEASNLGLDVRSEPLIGFGNRAEPLITVQGSQAVVDGPGFLNLVAQTSGLQALETPRGGARLTIDLGLADPDVHAIAESALRKLPLPGRNLDRWVLP